MNTDHFDYFIAIAETGSISAASRRLNVSQPVLSRYLSNIEAEYNTVFFLRDSHSLKITETGMIYLNGVSRMKELQIQLLRSISQSLGIKTRKISVGMSPYRGGREIASFYPSLLRRYPNIDLTVKEGNAAELIEMLHSKKLDTVINLYDPELNHDIKPATLIRSELLLALPNYHPLCKSCKKDKNGIGFISKEQLQNLNDVLFISAGTDSVIGQVIEKLCYYYKFTPQNLLKTSNAIAISSLLSSGSYAGFRLENALKGQQNIFSFHLPEPVYLYSGMLFANDHQLTEEEQYLYYLEYIQAKSDTPDILHINPLGRQILSNIEKLLKGKVLT